MTKNKEEHAAYMRSYRKAHPNYGKIYSIAYNEAHREEHRACDNARRAADPEKFRAKGRAWSAAHPDIEQGRRRRWAATHHQEHAEYERRRRALLLGAAIGPINLEAIKQRDRMICCVCNEKVDGRLKHPHPNSLSFDHSHPISLGGPHCQENLRVAHKRCNQRRHAGWLPVQMVMV